MRFALVLAALLTLCTFSARAQEPEDNIYHMSPRGCENYAQDGLRVALMRAGGITEKEVRRVFGTLRVEWYNETTWAFFSALITEAYARNLQEDVGRWSRRVFAQCAMRGGLIKPGGA